MQQLAFAVFNGLASGMSIFLVAAGVTLIFGILKVMNFSHGAFFMLGAYVAYSILGVGGGSIGMLLLASLAAGLFVAACGFVVDRVVLSRIRGTDEHFVLIATFALLLIVEGAVKLVWGVDYHSVAEPDALAGALVLGKVILPTYSFFIIIVGLIAFVLLDVGLHRLWIGKLLRSLVSDSWIIGLFGYNVAALYTFTVMLAFFLAGAAGGLLVPNQSLSPTLADSYLLLGFVCCIIGGLGNVRGAFIAALMLGCVDSLSATLLNVLPGLTVYIAMVLAILFRPQGLFGTALTTAPVRRGMLLFRRRPSTGGAAVARKVNSNPVPVFPEVADLRLSDRRKSLLFPALGAVIIAVAASMPFWANSGVVFLAGITAIEVLFALSWNFLFAYAGIVSFGHAAFFAIGAYCVGVLLKSPLGVPFPLMLVAATLIGALGAAVVGGIALRRASGIYLAILTMSLAEILRIIISSSTLLGRNDGLASIPRPSIEFGFFQIDLTTDAAYFWFILLMVGLGGAFLWWLSHGRFGRVLRAVNQDAERAAFIGVDVPAYRWRAFVISGAVAAFVGGLSAPWAQIVSPEVANLNHSVAAVLDTLLGGATSFYGPALGAAVFAVVGFATRTLPGLSEIITGTLLLIVVLVAPEGIIGLVRKLERRLEFGAKASRFQITSNTDGLRGDLTS